MDIQKKKIFNVKGLVIYIAIFAIVLTLGTSYAYFIYNQEGNEHNAIAGSLFMDIESDNAINITGMYPMTDEDGIKNGVKYNFSVSGYNTTDKDIYYGVYVLDGDEIKNKTRFKHSDIKIYLEETVNGETKIVYGPVNLQDFNESLIHVNTVDKNIAKDKEITIDYTLTMWIDQRVLISDTEKDIPGRSIYTTEEFKNSYASLKVEVEGLIEKMNMPLSIETSDTYVENNKAYFIAKISNYHKPEDLGKNANDEMKLEITGTNSDIVFSYKDSEGNVVTETSEKLDLNYLFNKNKSVEIQVFVTPKNDANVTTDISLKLTQNGEVKQNIIKTMNVYGNNFCLNNGFNKLYDCILASDSLATTISTAKANIEAKGAPNLNDTAPTYTYVEDITYDVANVASYIGYQFFFGDSYEFNSKTGTFRIYNSDGSSIITDYLSDTYKNYYTCGYTPNSYTSCGTIYRIDSTSVNGTTYTITQGDRITYKVATSIRSEVGLYKTEDDYGDAYVFRGDITNNNVAFGGYYWKIIRTNGDNSIRLIYNGTTTSNAPGKNTSINNTTYTYSQNYGDETGPRYADPTYVGYMYGKNFKLQTSSLTTYENIVALTKYYFADGYEFDAEKEVFRLKKVNLEPVSGTFTEMKDSYATYPYSCGSTTATGVCQVLLKVDSWVNEKTVKVQYISYSSVDKDGTRTNELSSNVKTQLESWYETNIVGKTDEDGDLITDYIVDGTFCNDRSTPNSSYASGYLLSQYTYYGAYTRLTSSVKTANLTCSNDIRDKFSSTISRGNGLLEYPVALITADEVALAGSLSGAKNENFYLNTGAYYWTMSPSIFDLSSAHVLVWIVYPTGVLSSSGYVTYSRSLRPVINISKDVLIASGDGTIDNPFQLKLA